MISFFAPTNIVYQCVSFGAPNRSVKEFAAELQLCISIFRQMTHWKRQFAVVSSRLTRPMLRGFCGSRGRINSEVKRKSLEERRGPTEKKTLSVLRARMPPIIKKTKKKKKNISDRSRCRQVFKTRSHLREAISMTLPLQHSVRGLAQSRTNRQMKTGDA